MEEEFFDPLVKLLRQSGFYLVPPPSMLRILMPLPVNGSTYPSIASASLIDKIVNSFFSWPLILNNVLIPPF